jgi:hypothetical protein
MSAEQVSIPPIVIGLIIGFSGSLLGALIDFMNSRRKGIDSIYGSFMLITAGIINSIAGIIAITISLIITGSIWSAIIIGLGVLVGFAFGFLLIAGIWMLVGDKNEPV